MKMNTEDISLSESSTEWFLPKNQEINWAWLIKHDWGLYFNKSLYTEHRDIDQIWLILVNDYRQFDRYLSNFCFAISIYLAGFLIESQNWNFTYYLLVHVISSWNILSIVSCITILYFLLNHLWRSLIHFR